MRIAFCWTLTILSSIGLAWVYVAGGQTQAEGALWATAFLGLGVGFILWGRDLMPGNDVIASRMGMLLELPLANSEVNVRPL